jgi:hypothetical protein
MGATKEQQLAEAEREQLARMGIPVSCPHCAEKFFIEYSSIDGYLDGHEEEAIPMTEKEEG